MAEKHYAGIVVCLAALMLVSVAGCTSGSGSSPRVSDIDTLQGTWVGTELGNRGGQWTLVIAGTAIDVKGPAPQAYSGTLKLNDKVEPKQADFVVEKCELTRYVGTTALGIYKIEGDRFTMAANEPGLPARPSHFEGGGGTRVFTFTRQ